MDLFIKQERVVVWLVGLPSLGIYWVLSFYKGFGLVSRGIRVGLDRPKSLVWFRSKIDLIIPKLGWEQSPKNLDWWGPLELI